MGQLVVHQGKSPSFVGLPHWFWALSRKSVPANWFGATVLIAFPSSGARVSTTTETIPGPREKVAKGRAKVLERSRNGKVADREQKIAFQEPLGFYSLHVSSVLYCSIFVAGPGRRLRHGLRPNLIITIRKSTKGKRRPRRLNGGQGD